MTKKETYVFTTYLNASHAIRWAAGTGQAHPHTFEIRYEFHKNAVELIPFNEVEDGVAAILTKLNGKFLNKEKPFDKLNPTLENLTNYLCDEISKELTNFDCVLESIAVSSSPTRTFRIQMI